MPDRGWRRDRPAPALQWAPSALRARSARRRDRNGPRHRESGMSFGSLQCGLNKCRHFDVVLAAGGALDAGACVHSPRLHLADGVAHVGFVQAAGEDDVTRTTGGAAPIETLARSAIVTFGCA